VQLGGLRDKKSKEKHLGFFNPGAAVLPGHSPGRIHGAGGHRGHGHPLSVPGAPQPGCVHHVCWKEEEHHGEGGRILLDQGGDGGRVHIGATNCGGIPDLAGLSSYKMDNKKV